MLVLKEVLVFIICSYVVFNYSFQYNSALKVFSYSDLLKTRERGRPRQVLGLTQRHIDVESGEYLCPLCKRLSNAAIPLLPALSFLDVKRSFILLSLELTLSTVMV